MRRIVLYFAFALILASCVTTKQIDLSNWNPASENVVNLSILFEDDGIESSPSILGKDLLIFESRKNDNSDLWSIDIKSKVGMTQLTTYDGPDRLPATHPDGKKYCFLSNRGETGLFLGEIGKPTVVSIVDVRKPHFGGWVKADFSPTGDTLVYVSGKYIWTYVFVTKTKTQFVQGTEPSWHPNGQKIIYRKISKSIGEYVSSSIWLMNNDGTQQTEIISGNEDYSYSGAKISPDGKKILYEKRKINIRGENVTFENADIWLCNIDGTEHTQITTHPLKDQEGVWLDNETIIFCSNRPQSGSAIDAKWDIWKLKINY